MREWKRSISAWESTYRPLLHRDPVWSVRAYRVAMFLISVGWKDDIAGSAEELAALMPNATAFAIEWRDHMLSVGDRTFKQRVLEFYRDHPL